MRKTRRVVRLENSEKLVKTLRKKNVLKVIKRDGRKTNFSKRRIREAISAAFRSCNVKTYNKINYVTQKCISNIYSKANSSTIQVEDIQDIIISTLVEIGYKEVANHYREYREERNISRQMKTDMMKTIEKIGTETTRDNANVGSNFSAKLLQIASTANKAYNLGKMPKKFSKAHELGFIHIHDADSYNLTINCLNLDTKKLLNRGFNTGYGTINKPKSIESAAALSCILLQSTQNDFFGGQSHTNFDNDMAEFVQASREKIRQEYLNLVNSLGFTVNKEDIEKEVEKRLVVSVRQAMQSVAYNLNSMSSRAGSQVPFSSINIGIPQSEDAALVCKIFLEEYEKGMGKGEHMIFPNIIFRVKKGVNYNPNDKYRYLYDLSLRVSAKRMNPTYKFLDAKQNLEFYNKGILANCMGCRTNVIGNINARTPEEESPAGRGNIAPVSINMVRLGILANKNIDKFFTMLDKSINFADNQLMHRYDVLKNLKVRDIPFVAGQMMVVGSEGLSADDSIEPILKQGSWAIGFIGLAETLVALTGKHHGESEESYKLGLKIIEFMRDKIESIKYKRQLNYSLYATPAEGLSGRFVAIDKKKFGEIKGVTDKGYYTNSYHVPVEYNISSIKKADIEAPFHDMCRAGHISYFEIDGGTIEEKVNYLRKHIDYCINNTDISYVAYNFRIKYCIECGENQSLDSCQCDKCGSRKFQGISRVTGYMSLDERFGPGKVAEREARTIHK